MTNYICALFVQELCQTWHAFARANIVHGESSQCKCDFITASELLFSLQVLLL